jgi:SMC interacting uncharacterized protein involved in chromosome segregation
MATKLQSNLVTKIQEIRQLKDTIQDLNEQLQEVKDESNNLEIALNKCIYSKAELNDKNEQLQDDLRQFMELYASTKVVAQNLSEAIYFLTKDKQHG